MATTRKATAKETLSATFVIEKPTKNKIRFSEVLKDELEAPVFGTTYISKEALSRIKWEKDREIIVTVAVK